MSTARASASNENAPVFDLNGDALVNFADVELWMKDEEIGHSWIGDANFDGELSSGDLVKVFEAGQYEDQPVGNSTWSTGDWNGDGDFDTSDLVVAFQDGGYEQGPRDAASAIPEPIAFCLFLLGGSLLARGRSGRR